MLSHPLSKGRVNVLIDGQWGSTGKGKLSGFLALRSDLALVTCDFAPNAGHTWRGSHAGVDRVLLTRQIPTSALNVDAAVAISAGSAISVPLLLRELEELEFLGVRRRLVIDYRALVVEDGHEREERSLLSIGSTAKGSGAALADKTLRRARLARDVEELKPYLGDVSQLVSNTLRTGGTILAESAQGFDLSLNHGHDYPFVTSRDVTPATVLNNIGAPVQSVGEVIGCLRTYPIRVGHVFDEVGTKVGDSGPCYGDQREVSWDEVRVSSGSPLDLTELTTVTKRVRRVFTFSRKQYLKFLRICAPSQLFVNFANHLDHANCGVRDVHLLSEKTRNWLQKLEDVSELGLWPYPRLSYVGTGPRDEDVVCL